MPSLLVRFAFPLLACALSAGAPALEPADRPRVGEPVARSLDRLDSSSLRFIYSSQLLPDSLTVASVPDASEPLATARALLAPHGLALVPVSATLYAVAAGTRPMPQPVAASTPRAENSAVPLVEAPPEPLTAAIVTGERNPFGLKLADDALLYSPARLGSQPVLGEDALVSLTRMPGITQGDLSGRLNIRGGGPDETLILLDGFPLRQPWHMPGYRGVLSLIDPGLLRQVAVYQGAIPARYGDRMSGVLDLQTLEPLSGPRHSLGAGFLNGRWRSDFALPGAPEGSDLLIATRYGATGYLTQAMQPAAGNPRYGDVYTRARLVMEPGTELVLNALLSTDTLTMNRDGLDERSNQRSDSAYLWLQGARRIALPRDDDARLSVWAGHTHFEATRSGALDSPGLARGQLSERRAADVFDLRARLDWAWANSHAAEAGIELSDGHASYVYDGVLDQNPALARSLGVPVRNAQRTDVAAERTSGALFIGDSWAVSPKLTLQLGLRRSFADAPDAASVGGWDPRLSAAFAITPATTLHTGWGRIHQVRDLTELGPQRDPSTQLVAQRTEYRLIGVDHQLDDRTLLRVEAFDKAQLHLLPQQRNLLRSPSILPELSFDRMWFAPRSARIRGIEATLQQSREGWRWSGAWAYSGRRERIGFAPEDRRHSGSLSFESSLGAWLLSAAANYRDGAPTVTFATNPMGGIVLSQYRASRLSDQITVDLRAKWRRPLGTGTFSVIGQVSNLFNSASCCSDFAPLPGSPADAPQLTLRRHGSLPAIPWAGVSWDF